MQPSCKSRVFDARNKLLFVVPTLLCSHPSALSFLVDASFLPVTPLLSLLTSHHHLVASPHLSQTQTLYLQSMTCQAPQSNKEFTSKISPRFRIKPSPPRETSHHAQLGRRDIYQISRFIQIKLQENTIQARNHGVNIGFDG